MTFQRSQGITLPNGLLDIENDVAILDGCRTKPHANGGTLEKVPTHG
jgi:hypothetical protein